MIECSFIVCSQKIYVTIWESISQSVYQMTQRWLTFSYYNQTKFNISVNSEVRTNVMPDIMSKCTQSWLQCVCSFLCQTSSATSEKSHLVCVWAVVPLQFSIESTSACGSNAAEQLLSEFPGMCSPKHLFDYSRYNPKFTNNIAFKRLNEYLILSLRFFD